MKQLFAILLLLLFIGQSSFGQSELKKEEVTWIDFEWADPDYKDVMLITSKLDTLDYFFRWQLDTGSPYTYLEGSTFKKFTDKFPYLADALTQSIMAIGIRYLHLLLNLRPRYCHL